MNEADSILLNFDYVLLYFCILLSRLGFMFLKVSPLSGILFHYLASWVQKSFIPFTDLN